MMTIQLPAASEQARRSSRDGGAAFVIAVLVALGASATLAAPAHADGTSTVARVPDGRWTLAEIRGARKLPRHPADIFEFDGKGLSGKIGCNWLSAAAVVEDGVVKYSDTKQTTLACRIKNDPFESRRMQVAGAALDGAHVERATPTRAEIVSKDGQTTLVFHRLRR